MKKTGVRAGLFYFAIWKEKHLVQVVPLAFGKHTITKHMLVNSICFLKIALSMTGNAMGVTSVCLSSF